MTEQSSLSVGRPLRGTYLLASRLVLVIIAVMLGLAMVTAVAGLPAKPVGLADVFHDTLRRGERLDWAEVKNPVTGVLLNFRAYDTLLEVAVLVLALWAAKALGPVGGLPATLLGTELLPRAVASVFVPVAVIVAGELLWLGSDYPGGAFQAGTVLGGALVLLRLTGIYGGLREGRPHQRLMLAAGFLVFSVVGLICLPLNGTFLDYPTGWAKFSIIVIEAAVMISVAVIFLGLFDRTVASGSSKDWTTNKNAASAEAPVS